VRLKGKVAVITGRDIVRAFARAAPMWWSTMSIPPPPKKLPRSGARAGEI